MNRNFFEKKIEEENYSKTNKRELQKKFLAKLKNVKQEEISSAKKENITIIKNKNNSNKDKKYKEEIVELKERLKKIEAKCTKYYNKKIESDEMCIKLKEENEKLKLNIQDMSNLLKISENKLLEIDNNNRLYNDLLSKYKKKELDIKSLKGRIKSISKKKNKMENEISLAKQDVSILNGKLNEANKQLIILNGIKSKSINDVVSDYFEELDYYLSYSNIHIYSKNIKDLNEHINNMKNNLSKHNIIDNSKEIQYLFGVIIEHNKKLWFNSTEDEIYEIESFKNNINADYPAKAILLESGKVHIEEVYNECMNDELSFATDKSNKYIQFKKQILTELNNKMEKNKFVNFGDYTVLIISKNNKEKYTKVLENHGLKVLWHNPFQDSPKLLEGKINNANIILVCKKYFHTNILKNYKGNNISYIEQDSEKSIEVRTRFMIVNNFIS